MGDSSSRSLNQLLLSCGRHLGWLPGGLGSAGTVTQHIFKGASDIYLALHSTSASGKLLTWWLRVQKASIPTDKVEWPSLWSHMVTMITFHYTLVVQSAMPHLYLREGIQSLYLYGTSKEIAATFWNHHRHIYIEKWEDTGQGLNNVHLSESLKVNFVNLLF